jgi:hypothetical protein
MSDNKQVSMVSNHKDLVSGDQYLLGFITAILEDNILDTRELKVLCQWCELHRSELGGTYPFDEISEIAYQGVNGPEEDRDEIFDDLSDYLDRLGDTLEIVRSDRGMQDKIRELHGMLAGVKSDCHVSVVEAEKLRSWVHENNELVDHWPVCDLYDIITEALEDGEISRFESETIIKFCEQFDEKNPTTYEWQKSENGFLLYSKKKSVDTIRSILYTGEITDLRNACVCFTGIMEVDRGLASRWAKSYGCEVKKSISKKVDYLVVGKKTNPCYAQSTYGLKIQSAIEKGIKIISEVVFLEMIGK